LVAVKGDVVELTDSTFTDKVRTSALSSNLCGFLQFPSVLCVCVCVRVLAFFTSWILVAAKRKRGETVIDKFRFHKCVYNKEDWSFGILCLLPGSSCDLHGVE
jgi:hypothetical protein